MLGKYLDNLTNYAVSVCDTFSDESQSTKGWELAPRGMNNTEEQQVETPHSIERSATIGPPVESELRFESELLSPRQQFYLMSASDPNSPQYFSKPPNMPESIPPLKLASDPCLPKSVLPLLPRIPIGEDSHSTPGAVFEAASSRLSIRRSRINCITTGEEDPWLRQSVSPKEVQKLFEGITLELKSRGMSLCLFEWSLLNFQHQNITLQRIIY